MDKTIQDLVSETVSFVHGTTSSGWHRIYCAVCGDGSRTKGPRGGWNFSDDTASYHCFNCGVVGTFDPNREYPFSKEMRQILDSFGVDSKEYNKLAYKHVLKNRTPSEIKKNNIEIPTFDIPDHFYLLSKANSDNIIAQKAKNYLLERKLCIGSYPFYLSTGISKNSPREEAIAKVLLNKLIIPFYKGNKLIYYQARTMDDSKNRYINADAKKDCIIFNYNQLFENTECPLFVTEGVFDAIHINGIAVLENRMTQKQIELISKSPRRKILIPDKFSDSSKLIDQFIDQEWDISVPDIGSCKDVNNAIIKYGKLYVAKTIMDNIHSSDNAKIFLKTSNFI